ncbi:MAG: L-rhamnose isomerase, partial [Fimbriimonas sp.]
MAYSEARDIYASWGIDTEQAIARALQIPISIHCWQSDDVAGFEVHDGGTDGGGILATGNYPGRARNADEVRQDYEKVLSLVPGAHRANLHASYAETSGKPVGRDELGPEHFQTWIDWAKAQGIGLDFNPTYFGHPKAASGFTLSHADPEIRAFWVRHGIASRRIAAAMAAAQGGEC